MPSYIDERGDKVSKADTQKKVEVTPVQARQGLLGRPVLMVLIGGLALAAVAWVAAESFGEATDNDPATEVQQAPATSQPASSTDQPTVDNTPPAGQAMEPAPAQTNPKPQSGTGVESGSGTAAPAPAN